MNKATTRPTIQTRYTAQAREDRRRAALERQEAQLAGVETVAQQYARLYSNVGRWYRDPTIRVKTL